MAFEGLAVRYTAVDFVLMWLLLRRCNLLMELTI